MPVNEILYIDPISEPAWDRFILSRPDAVFFHTSNWARVLKQSYGFKFIYLIAKNGNEITDALPLVEVKDFFGRKKAVSLPFSDFCEPLCLSASTFRALFSAGIDIAQKNGWKSIELRGGEQFLSNEPVWSTCFTHDIDLTKSEKDLLCGLRDSTRRNIRKAEKEGVKVSHETTAEAMWEFYRLNCLARREHGLPPQPKSFFSNLFAIIIAHQNGFISVARLNGIPIAAYLFMITGRKALYKYGASDRHYQRLRPNNILIWEGLLHCKSLGATSLNLGRTEPQHAGLLQFKRGLGCLEKKVNYYRYDTQDASYKTGKMKNGDGISSKIFKITPIPILRLLGTLTYRYVG
jgi:lipid II:glycine glycyltransferase (peptidoglycan interpeptide bridge formation enzyme)